MIEVCSRSTFEEDLYRKRGVYADVFGTAEYVLFDPDGDVLPGRLRAYRLVDGVYQVASDGEPFASEVAGGTFQVIDGALRLVDPAGRVVPGFADEGLRAGRAEGRAEGLRAAIAAVLVQRFGALPAGAADRLAGSANEAALLRLLARAAEAATLDEVWEGSESGGRPRGDAGVRGAHVLGDAGSLVGRRRVSSE